MSDITFKVPITLKELANRVSRALEPDTGGYFVFDSLSDDEFALAIMPTCERYAQNLLSISTAEELNTYVVEDYKSRWSKLEPPTNSEIALFFNSLIIIKE